MTTNKESAAARLARHYDYLNERAEAARARRRLEVTQAEAADQAAKRVEGNRNG